MRRIRQLLKLYMQAVPMTFPILFVFVEKVNVVQCVFAQYNIIDFSLPEYVSALSYSGTTPTRPRRRRGV